MKLNHNVTAVSYLFLLNMSLKLSKANQPKEIPTLHYQTIVVLRYYGILSQFGTIITAKIALDLGLYMAMYTFNSFNTSHDQQTQKDYDRRAGDFYLAF